MKQVVMDEVRSRDELEQRCAGGQRPEFLFFWGHTPSGTGNGADKSCLSQWFPAAFADADGNSYATAEHWMMAEKARLFKDDAMIDRILKAATPKEAKALGRQVSDFNPAVWNEHRFAIVVAGNVLKFQQHPAMAAFLKATGQAVLVEAAPRDRIWGIGMGAANANAGHPEHWRGQNLLGFALMEVRQRMLQHVSST